MIENDRIYLLSARQYKSISNIEKINNLSDLTDFGYSFIINLQTKSRLSSTVNICITEDELRESIINPIRDLINDRKKLIVEPKRIKITNIITRKLFPFYKLNTLLPDSYSRNQAKSHGCVEYLNMEFSIEDKRFIVIKSHVSYRWLLFKHAPKIIQPEKIMLSIDDAETFIDNLELIF